VKLAIDLMRVTRVNPNLEKGVTSIVSSADTVLQTGTKTRDAGLLAQGDSFYKVACAFFARICRRGAID
jgi:hypothetical protein